jgi:hypothetical protein
MVALVARMEKVHTKALLGKSQGKRETWEILVWMEGYC